MKKFFKFFTDKFGELETIEEKSFWIMAVATITMGVISLISLKMYDSSVPGVLSGLLLLIVPSILAFGVAQHKFSYHRTYPILCIFIGAICTPTAFVLDGGFESGMPVYCLLGSALTAFCYERRWRIISLLSCLGGTGIAFYVVWTRGSLYPLKSLEAVYTDIEFAYYLSTLITFLALSIVIADARKYRFNQRIFEQYFDTEVQKRILDDPDSSQNKVEGEKGTAVILFADITRFTTTTEKMTPEMAAQLLNDFFSLAEKHIHARNGIIDKFIGDCVMAYWCSADNESNVLNAVRAVLDMKEDIYLHSEELFKKYGTEINFSAGVSYGDVIFGNIGSKSMHNYTVIGDAVNTASRIEGYAVSGELLLSGGAAALIKDHVVLEPAESQIYLRGKNAAENLYRVIGLNDPANQEPAEAEDGGESLATQFRGYRLYVCGCRGSFPVSGLRFSEYGGETSCYVLKKNRYALIIDCGTGLKNAVDLLTDCTKIDIVLTHVHYDHILGFLSSQLPADVPIRIMGNFREWETKKNSFSGFMEHPFWPIGVRQMELVNAVLGEEISLPESIRATFYRSDHPDNGCVIKLMCEDRKVCIFADCEDADKLDPEIGRNSDVLFYDGMYDDEDVADHTGWGHGTWQNGIAYGKKQNIKKLVITHHNPECGDHTLLRKEKLAKTMLKNVSFAKTGDCIYI